MGFWDGGTGGGFDPSLPQTITAPWTFENGPATIQLNSAGMQVSGGDISTNGVVSSVGSGVATLNGNTGIVFNSGGGTVATVADVISLLNTGLNVEFILFNDPGVTGAGIMQSFAGNVFRLTIPDGPTANNTTAFAELSGTVDVTP